MTYEFKDSEYGITSNNHVLIIFDWDDTLLATSFLIDQKIELHSECNLLGPHWDSLQKLSKAVIEIVTICKLYGEVVIITNAEEGWVQLSTQKFMPAFIPLLKGLKIISAKSSYEKLYPNNVYLWKYLAMRNLILEKKYSEESKKNIISFGDSLIERSGAHLMSKTFSNTLSKTVKFEDRPNITNLISQLNFLKEKIKYIVEHNGNLDQQLILQL